MRLSVVTSVWILQTGFYLRPKPKVQVMQGLTRNCVSSYSSSALEYQFLQYLNFKQLISKLLANADPYRAKKVYIIV